MQKIFSRFIIAAIVFLSLPLQSMAWGMLGHRIVGEIADHYLSAKARLEIGKILGTESIAMASNWADFIKSDTTYKYLSNWHWIDFTKGISYDQMKEELKKDTSANAYTKINFLIKELKKKNLPAEKKLMYLRLLIHIAGDIHQPLHVSPQGSSGGNDIKLNWFNEASNLHRVWDEHLIQYQQLSYTEYARAINHATPAQLKKWKMEPMSLWLFDSYHIAEQLIDEIKDQNPKLGFRYNFDHVATVNEQLLKGGIHLATILNDIYGR